MEKLMPILTTSCAAAPPEASATAPAATNAKVNCLRRIGSSQLRMPSPRPAVILAQGERSATIAANDCDGLQEAELAQFATQRLRHVPRARRGAVEIARSILVREVAPALECAPRPRLDQDELRLQHQIAAADPALVDERAHVEEPLPAHYLAADHPVERAALAQLVGALGHHARAMQMLARQLTLPALRELLANPVLEVLDRVAADAELDEVKGHDELCQADCDEIIARAGRAAASVPIPKFANPRGPPDANFGIKGTPATL